MGADDDSIRLTKWRSALRSLLASLPSDYANAGPVASAMRDIFHEELAAVMEPRLNAQLKAMKQDTHAEKRVLASWVNHELHYVLGLSIRCPRTQRAAILVTDIRDAETQACRFRLEVHKPDGQKTRTFSAAKLTELRLMGDPPRKESFSRWGKFPGHSGPSR